MCATRSAHTLAWLFVVATRVAACSPAELIPYDRQPPVDLHDLLMDVSALPGNWTATAVTSSPDQSSADVADEDLSIGFAPATESGSEVGGGLGHSLYRFRNPTLAARMYERLKNDDLFFYSGGPWSQEPPPQWQPGTRHADAVWPRCREAYFRFYCGEIARYGEFVSIVDALVVMETPNMKPTTLTIDELESALVTLDAQFVEALISTTSDHSN